MLFNPSWSGPFTMPHFIAWLEGAADRDKSYNYLNGCGCLVAQYYQAQGGEKYHSPGADMIAANDGKWPAAFPADRPFIEQAEWIARGSNAWRCAEHTFGQALDRALEATSTLAIA